MVGRRRYYRMQKGAVIRLEGWKLRLATFKIALLDWSSGTLGLATEYEVHEVRKGLERSHRVWTRAEIDQ